MANTILRGIRVTLLVAFVFITAYGTTRQWMETGSPIRHECTR